MNSQDPESLQVALRVIDALEALGLPYHLGGSYASSIHGVPRYTQDVDLVVKLDPENAVALAENQSKEFYVDAQAARQAALDRRSFNLVHLKSGVKVDIFVCGDEPFDQEELRRSQKLCLQTDPKRMVSVKSPEDTVLRKLQWYHAGGEVSDRQWGEIMGIIATQSTQLDQEYLQRWSRELRVSELLDRALREASAH